jgi:hypothetical protein
VIRASGQWVGPAFYNMGAGSVGFQIGVDVSEVVMLVMTEKAMNALLSPSFKLGGDISVAAGPVGAGAGSNITADVISFRASERRLCRNQSRGRRDRAGQQGQRRLLRQACVSRRHSRSPQRRKPGLAVVASITESSAWLASRRAGAGAPGCTRGPARAAMGA